MKGLQVIKGIECYEDESGIVQLNLEQIAKGLGFIQVKNKVEYVRWDRVNGHLNSFGFSPQVGKEKFIPEPIFYMLAMKAENEIAKSFQKVVAYEILPQIRKKGLYIPKNLSKELQAIFVLDEKTSQLEEEVKDIKENSPLFNIECETLQKALQAKGTKILGGKDSHAYKDKSLRTKLYSDMQREVKRQFGLHSYKALKRKQLDAALKIIENYSAPLVIQDDITLLNGQVEFAS